MTTAAPSTAVATIQPAFTDSERLALAGYLAGYRGLTREAYALDLRPANTGPHRPRSQCGQDTGSCSSEHPPTPRTITPVCVRYHPCIRRYMRCWLPRDRSDAVTLR